ncbi:hypothetical protein QUC31_019101 [Theobroma cacao]
MELGLSPLSLNSEARQEPHVNVGHGNSQTVQGVSFFGPNDEYVMSASDCGPIFIWKKKDAKLVRLMVGDPHIVNNLEPHPCMPFLATCGLDKNVKLWAPMASDAPALPNKLEKIMEFNRQRQADQPRVSSDVFLMHVSREQRRQTFAFFERRYGRADLDSDEDGGEDYNNSLLLNDTAFYEDDSSKNSGECKIS